MSEHQREERPVRRELIDLFAGAAIGFLVGFLIGLSVSEIVGAAVGALTALIAAFFGLTAESRPASARLGRVTGFALAAVVGLLAGIYLRTHDSLSESLRSRVDEWVSAGYSKPTARALVVYQRTGLLPEGWSRASDPRPASSDSTALFRGSSEECGRLDPKSFPDANELANAFALAGGDWARVARPSDGTAVDRELLEAVWRLACAG